MATTLFHPVLRHVYTLAAPHAAGSGDAELLARFAARRDEGAFALLVRRHGPMVLAVCRRVLRDADAADDAFQATFLVLARKAGSLARPELLGHWLYRVAVRTAGRLRARLARRQRPLRELTYEPAVTPADDLVRRELRGVLDDAVDRLPEKYRRPVVLCYLQGLTNAEAARLLGCPAGTVVTWLARGRRRLRAELRRRGVTLPVGAAVTLLGAREALAAETVGHTARLTTGGVAGHVAMLADGVVRGLLLARVKTAALALLLVGLALGGGTVAARALPATAPADDERAVADAPAVVKVSYQTANFRVDAPAPDLATRILQEAERQRKVVARAWLGRELAPWEPLCAVTVRLEAVAGSSSSFQFDAGRLRRLTMTLEGPADQLLGDLLPHEVTHAVLADHFGAPVPRWADEGAAMLSESEASQNRHAALMGRVRAKAARLIPLRRLLDLRDYPPADVDAFYAESFSLTRFLVRSRDRKTLLAFVADGPRVGWSLAVKRHYGYRDVDALEQAWLKDLPDHGEPAVTAAGTLPTGPAPGQAFVRLEPAGALIVRRPVVHYRSLGAGVFEPVDYVGTEAYDLEAVRVYDMTGRPVDRKTLTGRLREETAALAVEGDGPPDALHLRLYKEGTLLFVLPHRPTPPGPPRP